MAYPTILPGARPIVRTVTARHRVRAVIRRRALSLILLHLYFGVYKNAFFRGKLCRTHCFTRLLGIHTKVRTVTARPKGRAAIGKRFNRPPFLHLCSRVHTDVGRPNRIAVFRRGLGRKAAPIYPFIRSSAKTIGKL